jgi:hypothetical protein
MLFRTGHDGRSVRTTGMTLDALQPSEEIVGSAGTGRLHD